MTSLEHVHLGDPHVAAHNDERDAINALQELTAELSATSTGPTSTLARIALVTGGLPADFVTAAAGSSGHFYLGDLPSGADWGVDEDHGLGRITYDNYGSIYFHEPGVYCTTLIFNADLHAADPTCSILGGIDIQDPFLTGFATEIRGGDTYNGHSNLVGSSRTYFDPGNGVSGGSIVYFMFQNMDVVNISNIGLLVQVQQIARG